jgi:hypothetical protein
MTTGTPAKIFVFYATKDGAEDRRHPPTTCSGKLRSTH